MENQNTFSGNDSNNEVIKAESDSLDIAETKANQVIEFSRINQHPLECKVQKQ